MTGDPRQRNDMPDRPVHPPVRPAPTPTPPECDPERVETVARAMFDADAEAYGWAPSYYDYRSTAQRYRRHAAAAIAADPSPAEEAVKRVEALCNEYSGGLWVRWVRAALASPAPAPQEPACQWAHGPVTDLDSRGLCPVCAEDEL